MNEQEPDPGLQALALWREWFTKGDGDPFYASEMGGDIYCFFCGKWQLSFDNPQHEEDCIYMRARRIIEVASKPPP